ncbi:MAG: hypothetical protein KBC35_02555 [Candidatus Pacebacteria bacterium]|nr:hypothetical protein [Candidatus Paceibacterota bacterium]
MRPILRLQIILIITLVVSVVVWLSYPDNLFINQLGSNFIIELVGIMMTVFLVEALLSSERKRDMKKYQTVAYGQLRIPVMRLRSLFLAMLQASYPKGGPYELDTRSTKFFPKGNLLNELKSLDLDKNAPVIPKRPWSSYIYENVKENIGELDAISDRYLPYFDSEVLELIVAIKTNVQIMLFKHIAINPQVNNELGFKNAKNFLHVSLEHLEVLFDDLEKLASYIAAYDKSASVSGNQWWENNDFVEKCGDGRLDEEIVQAMKQRM